MGREEERLKRERGKSREEERRQKKERERERARGVMRMGKNEGCASLREKREWRLIFDS